MLSDDTIDKLIQPLVDRQEKLTQYVISIIAQRVKETGKMLPSDIYRLERLFRTGSDVRKINEEIARVTGLQIKAIKKLIEYVAEDAYKDAKPYYDYRLKPFIPFNENTPLQRVVKAIENQTLGEYTNLSQARAFMLRDPTNPKKLIATPLSKAYYSAVDKAVQATQSGIVDYNSAMQSTMEQLSASGIRTVIYNPENGRKYTQRMEEAVKRNVLDGIRAINQGVQDEIGRQIEADGKEISVHEHSAPDHEPIQGHQFTNEEYEKLQNNQAFKDYNGRTFGPIDRNIGEYNCRHFTYSVILGVEKPNFTQEQLDANIERNRKGYTTAKGTHLTLYECTQKQRAFERDIRQAKRDILTGEACGDKAMIDKAKAKLSMYNKQYRAFSQACGLPIRLNNLKVINYK